MRIALVTPGFSASEDDWCIPVHLNLVHRFAQEHEVHVFALRYPYRRDSYRVYGARVEAFGGAQGAGVARVPLLMRAVISVVRAGREQRFDVIHAMWGDEAGFVAVVAARLLGVPVVVSLLGGELERMPEIGYGHGLSRAARWLVSFSLRHADCVTVGSAYHYARAAPHVHGKRLVQLPVGVDGTRFFPAPTTLALEGDPTLLHVGGLSLVKDQDTLLRAFAKVVPQAPAAHLNIVGDGPLRGELEQLAADLGVAEHLTFHGSVTQECLPDYYRAADLFLMTSRHEGLPMVALEAAATAVPLVGTAVGVMAELEPAARTVPVRDAEALAKALLALLSERDQWPALGRAGRAAVEERYSLTHSCEELLALYVQLAQRQRG